MKGFLKICAQLQMRFISSPIFIQKFCCDLFPIPVSTLIIGLLFRSCNIKLDFSQQKKQIKNTRNIYFLIKMKKNCFFFYFSDLKIKSQAFHCVTGLGLSIQRLVFLFFFFISLKCVAFSTKFLFLFLFFFFILFFLNSSLA